MYAGGPVASNLTIITSLQPLVLERVPGELEARAGGPVSWLHTKVRTRQGLVVVPSVARNPGMPTGWVAGGWGWGLRGTRRFGLPPTHTHGDALSDAPVSAQCPPDRGWCAARQALYKLSTESRSILRGCSTDMCQQAWVPDGVSLRQSSQRSIDGARQLSRSNVVAAPPLRKTRSTAASAASAD